MKILFIDLSAGVAGDMLNAALFGLHKNKKVIDDVLKSLNLPDVFVETNLIKKQSLSAWTFKVHLTEKEHKHRGLSDIIEIIKKASIGKKASEIAIKTFTLLAEAESKVHDLPVDKIHFHEVGADDAIVDIVCAAVQIEYLGIEKIFSTPFTLESGGKTESEHGLIPLPAPAVMEIVKGKPVKIRDIQTEITTPTGAAIVATLTDSFEIPQEWIPEISSFAAGTKDIPFPNLLRIVLGRMEDKALNEKIFIIETNIDNMNPQVLPNVISGLLEIGSLDAWITGILMKKSRPGWLITAIAKENDIKKISDFLFTQTTTIGIRFFPVERICLKRNIVTKETPFGSIRFKEVILPDNSVRLYPEFEDVKKISEKENIPLTEILRKLI